tara:strand:- start:1382 stop:1633 length:252 start_codon:yes stop_codon:yes gene_type:complete
MSNRNVKRRVELRPEVQEAVNDILNGKNMDSGTEWLQREYMRLMKREAGFKSKEQALKKNESKLSSENVEKNGEIVKQDRPAE